MMDAFSSAAQNTSFAGRRLHLGICGSIACYKMADVLRALLKMGLHVSVTLTDGARHGFAMNAIWKVHRKKV